MTAAHVVILAAAVAWLALAQWAQRAEARRDEVARQDEEARRDAVAQWAQRAEARRDAVARHPSRRKAAPGLPVDGEPLSKAELDEYTAIMLRPVREPQAGNDGKPAAGQGQDAGETR